MTNQTPNQKKNPAIAADLPEHARERMAMMQQGGKQSHLFTSDLSVNEFLLVKEAGFEPLGLVVGCSMSHRSRRYAGSSISSELRGKGTSGFNRRVHRVL